MVKASVVGNRGDLTFQPMREVVDGFGMEEWKELEVVAASIKKYYVIQHFGQGN